jgi:hypothetical protein
MNRNINIIKSMDKAEGTTENIVKNNFSSSGKRLNIIREYLIM